MNTKNTIWAKWLRRVSQLMAIVLVTTTFSGQAFARIIFQDDDFHDVVSEGLIINSDDGGDEDVTLQFGNDATDATITFDDGTGDVTFATDGGDFSFDNDNITTTGNVTTEGLDANGVTTIGDGGDTVTIDSSSWDISGAGIGSGFTGFTSSGIIDFSGASRFAMHSGGSDPGTCTEGDLFYNTASNATKVCTATNTWTTLSTGGADDFESVYGADGDNTLTTSNGNFSIAAGTGDVNIDGDSLSFDGTNASNFTVATDAAAEDLTIGITGATNSSLVLNSSGTGTDAVDLNATGTGGGIDVDTTDGGIAINAGGAANGDVTIGAGDDLTVDAVGLLELNSSAGVISIGNDDIDQAINVGTDGERTITIGNTNGATALDLNANGAIGVNSDDGSVTIGADDTDNAGNDNVVLLSGNAAPDAGEDGNDIALEAEDDVLIEATGALDVDAATADITTTGQFGINTSTWDISGAGAASGFTTISGSGDITTSGGDFIIGTTGLSETNGGGDNGATLVGVDQTEFANSSSTNVQDVLDDFDALIGSNAPNVDTLVFEPEYQNYALFADGSSNRGKMEVLYDNTNREQYYRWTTNRNASHDMDIRFRFTVPTDYASAGAMTFRLRTDTTTGGDNSVDITVRNDTNNATCHADGTTTGAAAGTWETVTITAGEIETGCTGGTVLDPGDVVEVQLKLAADNTSSGGTDVGTIEFAYNN